MSDENKEKMLELLSDKAIFGLSDAELSELTELEKDFPELNDDSFELAAASIGMLNLDTNEPLPAHLQTKITRDAEKYFASQKEVSAEAAATPAEKEEFQKTFTLAPKNSIRSWLGWAVAAFACVVMIVNIYSTNRQMEDLASTMRTEIDRLKLLNSSLTPKLTPTQEREQLLASSPDILQSTWGDLDPKKPHNMKGDVVWSNAAQKGFVRFSNLPVNDKTKEQYQVWIFDENQKYPVDGGVFDANEAGEIIIPIDAKIKIQKPKMFAVTAEKPGGVVVSPLEKVMAVAKLAA
ncbi:MAG TPA: anti-sigma factor [Pyrinomonadaceae bacterium]|jgi:anti-sigma-K factor RskA